MSMRTTMILVESLFEPTVADKAIDAAYANLDDEWGSVVLDTLGQKSSHPHRFDWPIEGDDIVILEQIEASEPGQGFGGMMMEAIVAACDQHGARIYLDANAFGDGLPQSALVSFYREWSFAPFPAMKNFANYPMMRAPAT